MDISYLHTILALSPWVVQTCITCLLHRYFDTLPPQVKSWLFHSGPLEWMSEKWRTTSRVSWRWHLNTFSNLFVIVLYTDIKCYVLLQLLIVAMYTMLHSRTLKLWPGVRVSQINSWTKCEAFVVTIVNIVCTFMTLNTFARCLSFTGSKNGLVVDIYWNILCLLTHTHKKLMIKTIVC